jgi:hypothetical protein
MNPQSRRLSMNSSRRSPIRRILPAAAALAAMMALSGCYYPYGPAGYAYPAYGYAPLPIPAPVIVGGGYYGGGYYGGGYRGWR